MKDKAKENFLKLNNWFCINERWFHPGLPKATDLESAYLYEKFKVVNEDENLFDDDQGA